MSPEFGKIIFTGLVNLRILNRKQVGPVKVSMRSSKKMAERSSRGRVLWPTKIWRWERWKGKNKIDWEATHEIESKQVSVVPSKAGEESISERNGVITVSQVLFGVEILIKVLLDWTIWGHCDTYKNSVCGGKGNPSISLIYAVLNLFLDCSKQRIMGFYFSQSLIKSNIIFYQFQHLIVSYISVLPSDFVFF